MWSQPKSKSQPKSQEKLSPAAMVAWIDECINSIDKAYRKLGSTFGITTPKYLPDLIRLKEDWQEMKSANEHTPRHACDSLRMRLDSIIQDQCANKPGYIEKMNKNLGDHHYHRLIALLSQDLHKKTDTYDVGWRSIEDIKTSPKYQKYPECSILAFTFA